MRVHYRVPVISFYYLELLSLSFVLSHAISSIRAAFSIQPRCPLDYRLLFLRAHPRAARAPREQSISFSLLDCNNLSFSTLHILPSDFYSFFYPSLSVFFADAARVARVRHAHFLHPLRLFLLFSSFSISVLRSLLSFQSLIFYLTPITFCPTRFN